MGRRKMMMILQNQTNAHNHHRPFSSSCESGGAAAADGVNGGDGDDGPTSMTMNISDISNVAAPLVTVAGGGRMAAAAASTLGLFPFTSSQWKELETQAMIYKYLMASIPVPPDLLFPISRYLSSDLDLSPASSSNSTLAVVRGYLRYSNNKDPEPWRCKRTDGKKWRCAKDVAPDQKYCERHLHRGRPRSRKPVEQVHHHCDFNSSSNNNKKGRFQSNVLPPNPLFCNAKVTGNVGRNLGSSTPRPCVVNPFFLDRSDKKACDFESLVSVSSYKEPRTMNWMMKGDAVPIASTSAPDQQWKQHLMQTKTGLTTSQNYYCNSNTSIFNQNYELEPLNLNSYANFVASEGQNIGTPRSFIDAWSNTEMKDKNGSFSNNASVSSIGKLSLSSLNLSMTSNNTVKDEMGHLQMGLGLIESNNNDYGGPLAEVLWPAVAGSASNLEFPMGRIGDSDSPQATTVSSPSGVLQKTLASLSDSSNCSSPTTLVVSRPEIAFQWLN